MKKSIRTGVLCFVFAVIAFFLLAVCRNIGFSKVKAYFSEFIFSDEFTDEVPFSDINFKTLNENEKKAYISIFNNIESHPDYIKIPFLTQEEFSNVYFAVKNDNPDILCFSDSCNMITFLSSCFLQVDYMYDSSVCDVMTEELSGRADEIIELLNTDDEYTAELFIHDYIIRNCIYDEDAENSSNAYGCLVDGAAVCSGYSRAAMLLLKKAGIDSMLVAGTGIAENNKAVSHMWNIVWIDSVPYHLDVTWDDADDANNTASHLFFNLTTSDVSADHKDISSSVKCVSESANYFVRENLLFASYGRNELQAIQERLCDNIDNGENSIEFCFADAEPYSRAVKAIIDNSIPRSDMYAIIDYVADNASAEVDMSHINFVTDDNKYYIRIMFDSV